MITRQQSAIISIKSRVHSWFSNLQRNNRTIRYAIIFIAIILGMTAGCSVGSNISEIPSNEQNDYKFVLLGQSDFICTDLDNKRLNISEIGKVITTDDTITVNTTKFASADIDSDGTEEVILWLNINNIDDYGFEILHNQNADIYGYTVPYRGLMNLKKDGTFIFSSGAFDSGIGKISFSETGYSIREQAYIQSEYDSNNELNIQYFINDEPCSENDFINAVNAQDHKPDVEWYDLSENNINEILN